MAKRPMDYFAKTLEKGMRILNLFDEKNSAWSLTAVAEKIGMNLTSTYRLVNTFIELGYLNKDSNSKILRLGPMAVAMGNRIIRGFDMHRLIDPLVNEIQCQYNVSIDISLFQSHFLVQVYNRETPNTLVYNQDVVSDFLYCTASGKAVMASLPDDELEELVRRQSFEARTEKTISGKEELYEDLASARKRGYATNNEEYIKGLIAIAAPVLNQSTKRPIGAACFTSTTLDQSLAEFEDKYSTVLREFANRLTGVIPNS
ncbi:IclR family transcriptional regulator [Desulfuromonas versatilis]|uniref:IclR family transcriptional regulator n=1 Tax=Desulfuromonas versatilis TaxID=2802975 RepID=A0ABM8HPI0_9BACT|nr:IclR family transcriptional regulator [Desulfuromonas versatilis]BCR03554.1 IclR family transcriptional regulator [Desulfuromonas versatilis]